MSSIVMTISRMKRTARFTQTARRVLPKLPLTDSGSAQTPPRKPAIAIDLPALARSHPPLLPGGTANQHWRGHPWSCPGSADLIDRNVRVDGAAREDDLCRRWHRDHLLSLPVVSAVIER